MRRRPAGPPQAKDLHAKWWEGRRARQAEIDASIAKNAETEYLYDRPYEQKGIVRVTGPFTVESLSPHRVLPADEEDAAWEELLREEAAEEGRELPPRRKPAKADGEWQGRERRGRFRPRRAREPEGRGGAEHQERASGSSSRA